MTALFPKPPRPSPLASGEMENAAGTDVNLHELILSLDTSFDLEHWEKQNAGRY